MHWDRAGACSDQRLSFFKLFRSLAVFVVRRPARDLWRYPYKRMIKEIIEISNLFINTSKDKDELIKLIEVVRNKERWLKSKAYFNEVRSKNLKVSDNDQELNALYAYIESCYKSIYNLSHPAAPFDADSPFRIVQNAVKYCKYKSISESEIIKILG